jgi:hypothetical protein
LSLADAAFGSLRLCIFRLFIASINLHSFISYRTSRILLQRMQISFGREIRSRLQNCEILRLYLRGL